MRVDNFCPEQVKIQIKVCVDVMRQANPVRLDLCQLPSPVCPLLQPHKKLFSYISWDIGDDKYSFRDSVSLLRRNLPDTTWDQEEESFHWNLNFPFQKNEKFIQF